MWTAGRFVKSPDRDTVVDESTVLLVTGRQSEVERLEADTYQGRDVDPTVVIAGYGVVGSTVRNGLERSGADCTVVDIEDRQEIDVVGDVTEEATLKAADVDEAAALVVTIRDDDEAILSVVLADELASDLDIIVRLNHDENERKVRRAGADYVLSLPEISGRVLAQEVLHENMLSYGRQLKTVRIAGEQFAGQRLGETAISRADRIVVAIDRDGELLTDLSTDFEFERGDSILLIGDDEEIDAVTD
jgi:Trk K+ transport system NAD-binding subunit